MTLNDPLANAMNVIDVNEKVGKKICYLKPSSKMLVSVLKILQKNKYIGNFEMLENSRGGVVKVDLVGRINKCNVIKPRYSVTVGEIETYEKQYLPSYNVGMLVLSTPNGIMSHKDAKDSGVGGVLLAYVY